MGTKHPSRDLSRTRTTDVERQNINLHFDLSKDIDRYLRQQEQTVDVSNCMQRHNINLTLRARMVDWMIEVLTNFKCDDQTFFIAISLMDRYFKGCTQVKEMSDLHITGVTCMFIASKFEDIYPLKMKTVHEKIAHKKLEIAKMKELELDIMRVIKYQIHAPTVLDFLKVYLLEVLEIQIQNKTLSKEKEEKALAHSQGKDLEQKHDHSATQLSQNYLIEKMSIYLAKMSLHDSELAQRMPSLLSIGSIYVALKICEQLKKQILISPKIVNKLIQVSRMPEDQILDVSQKVLYLAQNFDKEFPGLENLKKTHFGVIT